MPVAALSKCRIAGPEGLRQPPSGKHLLQWFQRRSQNHRSNVSQSFDEPDLVQLSEQAERRPPSVRSAAIPKEEPRTPRTGVRATHFSPQISQMTQMKDGESKS